MTPAKHKIAVRPERSRRVWLSPSTARLRQTLRINFTKGEVEATSLRSVEGFDKLSLNGLWEICISPITYSG